MAVFQPVVVATADGTLVSLRRIESMNFVRDEQEKIVDALKADCSIAIVTDSGREYQISMLRQIEVFAKGYNVSKDVQELRTAIFERWLSFIS